MALNRRQFVSASIAAAGLSTLPSIINAGTPSAPKKLTILFLGGTGFLGPHTVQYALDRGHEVTLFNRGRTNKDLFPELEKIVGNRDPKKGKGLSALKGRQWDAVIDTSGYVPRLVGASSQLLAESTKQYLFVSTICQYDNWAEGGNNGTESRARAKLDNPTTEDVSTHYCALKAYCETAAEKAMPGRVTHIRPGLIVGPRDKTDRFTYWPVRIDQGGEVLAPGKPSDLTQLIDVRDLAMFMVHSLEKKLMGEYNLICPPFPFGDLMKSCLKNSSSKTKLTWVPADFMAKNDVNPWRDVFMWADSNSPGSGALTWSGQKALDAGLTIRPIDETVKDTLAWFKSLPKERQNKLRAGMSKQKEAKVLKAWHQSQKA
ncbi:NAD-dependent epimerase/dehydratase family protein [Aliikangiella sp. IMCC44359]|uniref:NAD-dependent epimerase/dehydratase family protein n=1 Tax=Aliikangiella sp. IMCC44359 TaxID=3459125 RepID=UPI00403AEB8A